MARLNAPRNAGNGRSGQRTDLAPQEPPQRKGWPFPEGSQNHLDDDAPWPRPPRGQPQQQQPERPETQ